MANNIISTGLNSGETIYNSNGGTVISGDAVKGGYFVTDTIENIPSWTNVLGTLCYCTEDFKFYQYNGTTWVEANLGSGGGGGGADLSNYYTKDEVEDYIASQILNGEW